MQRIEYNVATPINFKLVNLVYASIFFLSDLIF